jgi:outer membrane protein TolC
MPFDLNAVGVVTVLRNPDLRAQRARASIADAQVFDARLLPDPTASLSLDKVVSGPDSLSNILVAVAQEINALRTRRVRIEGAAAASRQVRLDLAWAEWQAVGQARIKAARVNALQHALKIAEVSHSAAQESLMRLLRASVRGDIGGEQVQAGRLAEVEAGQRVRTIAKDLAEASGELMRLMGFPPATPIRIAGVQLPPLPPPAAALTRTAEAQRLDLQALRAGYASQEAAVHLAVLSQFPSLNLGLSANRDTSGNKLTGASVDLTLPLWNRNRGQIAIERATRSALKAEFEARIFNTRAEIAAAVRALTLNWSNRADVLSQLPALRNFSKASSRAAARGDIPTVTAISAADALRDKELLLVQLDESIIEQSIALELLTGVPRQDWQA